MNWKNAKPLTGEEIDAFINSGSAKPDPIVIWTDVVYDKDQKEFEDQTNTNRLTSK